MQHSHQRRSPNCRSNNCNRTNSKTKTAKKIIEKGQRQVKVALGSRSSDSCLMCSCLLSIFPSVHSIAFNWIASSQRTTMTSTLLRSRQHHQLWIDFFGPRSPFPITNSPHSLSFSFSPPFLHFSPFFFFLFFCFCFLLLILSAFDSFIASMLFFFVPLFISSHFFPFLIFFFGFDSMRSEMIRCRSARRKAGDVPQTQRPPSKNQAQHQK